jgi:hypothetical protein
VGVIREGEAMRGRDGSNLVQTNHTIIAGIKINTRKRGGKRERERERERSKCVVDDTD